MLRANELIAVVNASPLVYLGKLGILDLLPRMFERVVTVLAVKDEVLDPGVPEYPVLAAAFSEWLSVSEVGSSPLLERLRQMGLHEGEIGSLALAYGIRRNAVESIIVIDDLAARDIARALGLHATGTVGVILGARKRGLLDKERAIAQIRTLVESTSFRMSERLYSKAMSELS